MNQIEETFTNIYRGNFWNSLESVSGPGSTLDQTKKIIEELPILYKKYGIRSVLDIPCGDYHWMESVNNRGINYIGADIVEDLIIENREKFPNVNFQHLDLVNSNLPKVDLIIARDVLVHMTYDVIQKAIENIVRSGAKYLLTTTFTSEEHNYDLSENGQWRPLNLLKVPFKFNPIYLINENCSEIDGNGNPYNDKCLVLFEIQKLKVAR